MLAVLMGRPPRREIFLGEIMTGVGNDIERVKL